MDSTTKAHSVAVIGNYSPRQCGIATFTTDLVQAIAPKVNNGNCWAVAVNDRMEGYHYSDKVRFEINQAQLADYHVAADFLNFHRPEVVCLQHEYGIFGGVAGSRILKLLAELQVPIVTTLHTVLSEPEKEYRQVMNRLAQLSSRLVVMSHKAEQILQEVYGIAAEKILYIPHGIPDIPLSGPESEGGHAEPCKKLLLTFGLLSVNKGIEYVLRALPAVVARFPELTYLVVGATHPHILRTEGENYRLQLQQEVSKLKLQNNVIFHNRFVTHEELCDYLGAADIYVTPYIEKAQITSGTLAYAMGSGLPVISTPYWYAEEMLADGRGSLVPFKDSKAISEVLIELLSNDGKRQEMCNRAYAFSRSAVWEQVASSYPGRMARTITSCFPKIFTSGRFPALYSNLVNPGNSSNSAIAAHLWKLQRAGWCSRMGWELCASIR